MGTEERAKAVTSQVIRVSVHLPGREENFTPAGLLIKNQSDGSVGFVYQESYMKQGLPPLDPAQLDYKKHGRFFPGKVPQAIVDALPGEWAAEQIQELEEGIDYQRLDQFDQLHWLGTRKAKGLRFQVLDDALEEMPAKNLDDLEGFRKTLMDDKYLERGGKKYLAELKKSEGGARPKWRLVDNKGYEWMCKFNQPGDPYNMAKMEHIALQTMRSAGIPAPVSTLATLPGSKEDVLLIRRYDLDGPGKQMHSVSMGALIGGNLLCDKPGDLADLASKADFSVYAGAVREASAKSSEDLEVLFGSMLMDLYLNNTDNHSKNFEMLLTKEGFRLSPQYDKTPDPFMKTPTTRFNGMQKFDPRNDHHLAFQGRPFGISLEKAQEINAKVEAAVEKIPELAAKVGLSEKDERALIASMKLGNPRMGALVESKMMPERPDVKPAGPLPAPR